MVRPYRDRTTGIPPLEPMVDESCCSSPNKPMNKPYLEDLKGNGHMVRTMTVVDEIKIKNPGYPKPMFYVQILEANGIHQPEIPLGTAHIRFGRYESRERETKSLSYFRPSLPDCCF
jgi:hypothetical protein